MVLFMVDRHCFRLNVRHLMFVVYFSNRLYNLILLIKDLQFGMKHLEQIHSTKKQVIFKISFVSSQFRVWNPFPPPKRSNNL